MSNLFSSLEVPIVPCYEANCSSLRVIGLLEPEFISFFLLHLNLLILVSFKKQNPNLH